MKNLLLAFGLVASLSSAAIASGPHASRHHPKSKVDQVTTSIEPGGLMLPVTISASAAQNAGTLYFDLINARFEHAGLTSRQMIAAKSIQLTVKCN
jgi:hypothetical protein